jgi:hypothetical protein
MLPSVPTAPSIFRSESDPHRRTAAANAILIRSGGKSLAHQWNGMVGGALRRDPRQIGQLKKPAHHLLGKRSGGFVNESGPDVTSGAPAAQG